MTLASTSASNITVVPIPRPDKVSAEFLGNLLTTGGRPCTIERLRMEPVGAGQLGETVRFHVDYRPGTTPGPATLIGKFASSDPASRDVAAGWALYAREVRFYRELARSARIRVPGFYGATMDDAGDFILLLEDLAPARVGDQFAGLAEEDAERAVREAARLHAAFWGQGERTTLAWLDTDAIAQPFYTASIFRSVWPAFRERYRDHLTAEHRAVCDAFAELYECYDTPRGRARTITHNDYRPDNMLFDNDRLVVVDWQSAALGSGAVDIAYLIGGAYARDARRATEPHLIEAYLNELWSQGVTDYTRDQFAADYRHFTFAGINVAVGAAMLVQRTERGDRLFLTMLDRHVSHVLDHDALALLRG